MHRHIEFILYAPVDQQPVQFDQTASDIVAQPEIENQPSCSILDTLQYVESRLWHASIQKILKFPSSRFK